MATKTEAVEGLLNDNPRMGAKEAIQKLDEMGITISQGYFYGIKNRLKTQGKSGKSAKKPLKQKRSQAATVAVVETTVAPDKDLLKTVAAIVGQSDIETVRAICAHGAVAEALVELDEASWDEVLAHLATIESVQRGLEGK